jgi:hypothetical protein
MATTARRKKHSVRTLVGGYGKVKKDLNETHGSLSATMDDSRRHMMDRIMKQKQKQKQLRLGYGLSERAQRVECKEVSDRGTNLL